ncbi:S1 RNA-binding domain-containing protein [archaeon]|nr:S1 RNA-binding domain-containing protein [archaeon]
MPREEEVVFCTVRKILPHSIFVDINEYENCTGMIHISEIAPGRIRNIRDYVKEGKRIVCLILKIDKGTKQIDLSLRRVPLAAAKSKEEELRQESKAEKIMQQFAQRLNIKPKMLFPEIMDKMLAKYKTVFECLKDVAASGQKPLQALGIPEKYSLPLVQLVQEKIKPPEYNVKKILEIRCNLGNGAEIIKNAFQAGKEYAHKSSINANFIYLGAPRYKIEVRSNNYKTSEQNMQKLLDIISERIKQGRGVLSWAGKALA